MDSKSESHIRSRFSLHCDTTSSSSLQKIRHIFTSLFSWCITLIGAFCNDSPPAQMRLPSDTILSASPAATQKKPFEGSSGDLTVRQMDFQTAVPHNPVLKKAGDKLQHVVLQIYAQLSSGSLSFRDLHGREPQLELAVFTYERFVKRMIRTGDELVVFLRIISAIQRCLHNFLMTLTSNNVKGRLCLEKTNREWDIFCRVVDIIVQPLKLLETGSSAGSPPFALLASKLLSLWEEIILADQIKRNFKESFLDLLNDFYYFGEIVDPQMISAIQGNLQIVLFLGVDVYEQFFERDFLEHTRRFYADYSQRYLDVLNNAQSRIHTDNTRAFLSLLDGV